ncbi:Hypothetical predicted protein [Octopus vulgaris]|uniref:Uncharacterized protein n=1 Tax=Octopus vulgaris TaxID=6645 RepID=A0AA36FEH5_OCTVU|nr:Hypothetical predicted protein [Octopus vulgaris]
MDEALLQWRELDFSVLETAENRWKQRGWRKICAQFLKQLRTDGSREDGENLCSGATFNSLFDQAIQFLRCHLLSASLKFLGDWIDALSVANISGLLNLDKLCNSFALRVEADICGGLRCCCSTGLHGLSCCLNAGCFAHHTELNLIIKQPLAWVNIPSVLGANEIIWK